MGRAATARIAHGAQWDGSVVREASGDHFGDRGGPVGAPSGPRRGALGARLVVWWQFPRGPRRREAGVHAPVHLQLVDGAAEALVVQINATIEQAERAGARLRRHEHRYRELVADLSHDLRTPLTAVRGYQPRLRNITRERMIATAREFIGADTWVLAGVSASDQKSLTRLNDKLEKLF